MKNNPLSATDASEFSGKPPEYTEDGTNTVTVTAHRGPSRGPSAFRPKVNIWPSFKPPNNVFGGGGGSTTTKTADPADEGEEGEDGSDEPDPCGPAPSLPGEASVAQNVAAARSFKKSTVAKASLLGQGTGPLVNVVARLNFLYNRVRNSGAWDYKQLGRRYEAAGNFNYGAAGAALGITDQTLLRAAGVAQSIAETSEPTFGSPFGTAPYGDDPLDQQSIREGIAYSVACAQGH